LTRTYRFTQKLEAVAEVLLQRLPLTLAALLLLAAIAINFANVLARYLFLASIYWADEAMVFLVIWSIFLAAIAVTYDGSHLTMDLFSARLPPRWQRSIPRSPRSASRPSRS
jgi:TRAP-type C4-dicarboxylate transport system permease small subunit